MPLSSSSPLQELAKKIEDAAASPTGMARPADYEFDPDDYNAFDGMSAEEAADFCTCQPFSVHKV